MNSMTTLMEVRGEREIVIQRSFAAGARTVFDAWTRADLVQRWWAPRSHGVSVRCEADVRDGGSYRYVLRSDTGQEMAFSGQYTEVSPPSRLVYTQVFEPMAGSGAAVVTVTFEERDGRTYVVVHSLFPNRQVRDQTVATGMEHGMRETMEQLEELLASAR
jgi:uncharacterized protein YndB with AHSA1/START domain